MLVVSMIFQTVAAQIETYTIDANDSDITIQSGQYFNASFEMGGIYFWHVGSYDDEILQITDDDYWSAYPGEISSYLHNWTFEGISTGFTTLTFHHLDMSLGDDPIYEIFTLNVTVNPSKSINLPLTLTVFTIIVVVPSVIILKWMKGEKT